MKYTKKMMLVPYDQAEHAIENREGEHSKSDMHQNKEKEQADTHESAPQGNLIGEELNRDLILLPIPKEYRSKARRLLERFNKTNELGWDGEGQVTAHGETIHGSHMDILKWFLYNGLDYIPLGYNRVEGLLKRINQTKLQRKHPPKEFHSKWKWINL